MMPRHQETTMDTSHYAYCDGCDARDRGMDYTSALDMSRTYGENADAFMRGWHDSGRVG